MKLKKSRWALDAEGPLVTSYNKWLSLVITSALLLQAWISPALNSVMNPDSGDPASTLSLVWSFISFVVSAGLIYSIWIQGLLKLYKNHLWFRLNKRYAILGVWDAGFEFQSNEDPTRADRPTGYVRFEQDYLGRVECALYYNYDPALRRYKSESSMTAYLTGSTDKPTFRIFFKTQHFGDSEFSKMADTALGIEVVEATEFSDENGYPTTLFGEFNFYQRSKESSLWSGHTRYKRNDDLSINHKTKNATELSAAS